MLFFLPRDVWVPCKKLYFEYHGLVVIIVFLEYLKLHSNPKGLFGNNVSQNHGFTILYFVIVMTIP
jgi:hypothetical protein